MLGQFLLIPAGRKFWFNDDRRQKFKDKTCLWLRPLRQRNQDFNEYILKFNEHYDLTINGPYSPMF